MPEQRASGPAPHRAVELATYVSGAPAFMAALSARLVVHNGCLVTVDEDGRRHHLLVFPVDDVSRHGRTLTYRGVGYRVGDFIEVSGGVMDVGTLHGLRVPEAWGRHRDRDRGCAFVVATSCVRGHGLDEQAAATDA